MYFDLQKLTLTTRKFDWSRLILSCKLHFLSPTVEWNMPSFVSTLVFFDECTFARDGAFNTHNKLIFVSVNPHAAFPHTHRWRFSINFRAEIVDDQIGLYLLKEHFDEGKYLTFLPVLLEEFQFISGDACDSNTMELHPILGERYDNIFDVTFQNGRIRQDGPVVQDCSVCYILVSFCRISWRIRCRIPLCRIQTKTQDFWLEYSIPFDKCFFAAGLLASLLIATLLSNYCIYYLKLLFNV